MDRESKAAAAVFTTQFMLNLLRNLIRTKAIDPELVLAIVEDSERSAAQRNPDEATAIHEIAHVFRTAISDPIARGLQDPDQPGPSHLV